MFAPAGNTVSLNDWLPEISVLCIMTALLLICFAMKKRDFAAEKANSAEQQTIDLLLSNEEPSPSELEEAPETQEGESNE